MRRFIFAVTAILLMFSLVACSSTSDLPDTKEDSLTENSTLDAEHTKPVNSGGAAIILNMNGTDVHAKLYDNSAANAFLDLLPYTVTVSRAADDLCGSVSEQLEHDPAEAQDTWAIGEIGWFDGRFTILCDNEEVVIGIPEELKGDGREFYIIRSHDGEYTLLPDTDDNPDTITVSTDIFSAYALV